MTTWDVSAHHRLWWDLYFISWRLSLSDQTHVVWGCWWVLAMHSRERNELHFLGGSFSGSLFLWLVSSHRFTSLFTRGDTDYAIQALPFSCSQLSKLLGIINCINWSVNVYVTQPGLQGCMETENTSFNICWCSNSFQLTGACRHLCKEKHSHL